MAGAVVQIQSVPNLIQGVSQQAEQQRRDTQCKAQFDCINSVADGAVSRPPTEIVGKLSGTTSLTGAFFYEMLREGENYLLGVHGEEPFAINLDTAALATVTWGSPDAYLDAAAGTDPADQFRAQVVEDTVFLANRKVSPAMATSPSSPARVPEALVHVSAGVYDSIFKVDLVSGTDVINATFHSDTDDWSRANATWIAEQLATQINGVSGFVCDQYASVLHIYRGDGADFTIDTDDENGDDIMVVVKGRASSFDKLPEKAPTGFVVRVGVDKKSKEADYWVTFEGDPSVGTWVETVAPNTKTTLDPAKMPHAFILTAPNTFTFGTKTWSTRIAGNEDNAKDPGFVGKFIRDVGYHQNRLLLLHSAGVVWSKSRYPFTFFPDTLQTILAEAPVDAVLIGGAASRGSTIPDFAVQFDKTLSLWSPQAQFAITWGQDGFRQETVDASPATAYTYSQGCDPLPLGQFLYFATDSGPYAAMRAIQSSNGRTVGDLFVTSHVPTYLGSGVRWLTGNDTLGIVFGVSETEPDILFVWNFLFQGTEFSQSAWSKWRIAGGTILWAGIRDNLLRILQQRDGEVVLLKVDLTPDAVDDITGAQYKTRLDLRVDEGQVESLAYDAGTNTTTFDLPYTYDDDDLRVIVSDSVEGGYSRGREFLVVSVVGGTVTVRGDLTPYSFYAGTRIRSERVESRFFIRSDKGVVPVDRLTVESFVAQFAKTGYTRIEVACPNKATRSYTYEARTSGLPGSDTGTPPIGTGQLRAAIGELAENVEVTLVNDSFLPSAWQSASWNYIAVGQSGIK